MSDYRDKREKSIGILGPGEGPPIDTTKPMVLARHGLPYIVPGPFNFTPDGEWLESIGPGGGSIQRGRLTIEQPLPTTLKQAYYHLPKNALHDGSVEGWYRVEFDSPTTGVVCELHMATNYDPGIKHIETREIPPGTY